VSSKGAASTLKKKRKKKEKGTARKKKEKGKRKGDSVNYCGSLSWLNSEGWLSVFVLST
jgi:hypothetical protein